MVPFSIPQPAQSWSSSMTCFPFWKRLFPVSWNADKSSSDPKFLQFLSSNIQIALPSWKRSASRLLCFKTNLNKIFPNTNSTSASWSSCVKYCWIQLNISGPGGGPFLMQDTCWIRGTFPAEEQDTCEITWISGCEIDNQVGTAGKLQQSLLTELVPLMHLVRRQAADIWDQLGLLKGLTHISTRQSEKCGSIHKRLNIPDQWPLTTAAFLSLTLGRCWRCYRM